MSDVVPTGTLGNEKEPADRLLGFEIAVRTNRVFEGIGAVDEDVQGPVFDPVHHLQRALAPLIDRLLRSIGTDGDETYSVRLLPQVDGRYGPSRVAVRDEGAGRRA